MAAIYDEKILSAKIVEKDLQIVRLLAEGKRVSQISKETGINNRTVEFRIGRLRSGMQIGTVAGLVAFFIRNKIID